MLRKFASAILSPVSDPEIEIQKFANAQDSPAVKRIAPYNPEHVYGRFRAIGCLEIDGPNANADGFPYGQFLDKRANYGYKSFEGKHAFVEHNSSNISNSVGDLHAAYLNRFNTLKFASKHWDEIPDMDRVQILSTRAAHEDGSIEVLMSVDKQLSPKIARMVEANSPVGVSMGTNIDYSECSICGNRAHVEANYCGHIRYSKGQNVLVPATQISDLVKKGTLKPEWLPHILMRGEDLQSVRTAARKMVYAKVFEVNYGLSFFELSFVANPAFSRGYKLEKIASAEEKKYFTPILKIANTPVAVAMEVSKPFFDEVARTYSSYSNEDVSKWTDDQWTTFSSDSGLVRDIFATGNVSSVFVPKYSAGDFVNSGIELSPTNHEHFYKIDDPSSLEDSVFSTPSENDTSSLHSILSLLRRPFMKKQAEYDSLPSTAEFTGDKSVEAREGETQLYHDWAEIGSKQIEKEKTSRPNGTIFVDAIVTKKVVSDHRATVKARIDQVRDLINRTKLALFAPEEFGKKMTESPMSTPPALPMSGGPSPMSGGPSAIPGGGGPGGMPGGGMPPMDSPMDGGLPPVKLTKEEAPEVLQNTLADLEETLTTLQSVEEALNGSENDAKAALARTKRWSASLVKHAEDVSKSAYDAVCEATSAIQDAVSKLQAAYDMATGATQPEEKSEPNFSESKDTPSSGDSKSEKSDSKPAEDKFKKSEESDKPAPKPENKTKTDTNDKGGAAMSKDASLSITSDSIELLKSLKGVLADTNPTPLTKTASVKKAETEEKEEEKEETKEEEKMETKEAAQVAKEAAAQPPTGARDPGDYAEPGGIEKVELTAWWKKFYPEFEKIKGYEDSKELNTPEGKVDLLTGPVGEYSGLSDFTPGKAPKDGVYGPKKMGAIAVRRFVNAADPRKTFYAVVKLAEDNSVESAFTASFEDTAGDTDSAQLYNRFLSNDYMNDIVAAVKQEGMPSVMAEMSGKVAQLEGVTPGKTEEVNPLYDSHESDKKSNQPREGMRPSPEDGHGKGASSDKGYYAKATGDSEYASQLQAAQTKIASLSDELVNLKRQNRVQAIAKRALHLARVAASRGMISFDLPSIEKQAKDYLNIDDNSYQAVYATLQAMPVVNKRALEAYQIPEAENMGSGVIHNSLNAVDRIRMEHSNAENVAPEGIQSSVKSDASITEASNDSMKKQAGIVPQLSVNSAADPSRIPDISRHFNTLENQLRRKGIWESSQKYLRSTRGSRG